MNPSLSWQDLGILNAVNKPAGYLKMICEVWGVAIKSIVEVGVFQGATSTQLRVLFPEATLYLIDPWEIYDGYLTKEAGPIVNNNIDFEKAYEIVKQTFAEDPKVKILRKTSMDALKDVPDGVDLVFIDGNHDYFHVKQDITHWLPKVRIGGILSGHDYRSEFPGVMKAVDEIFPKGVAIGLDHTWLTKKN